MNDSSGDVAEILGKVDVKRVHRLLSVILQSNLRKVSFIERRYAEGATNFRETLEFLRELGWISERDNELDVVPALATISGWLESEEAIRQAILVALIGKASPYRSAVAAYVNNFRVTGAELNHRPNLSERTEQRPLRDLLMDLRVVSYRALDQAYILDQSAGPMYVWATNFFRPKSRRAHELLQRRREELGFAAELAMVEYERRRLGPTFAHLIEHVSEDQPYACYDIRSATVVGDQVTDRFIEVKAVPEDTLQFYWTRSEVDTARVLREKYYLYLVPATRHGFDIEAVTLLCDPYPVLTAERSSWEIEEGVIICRRKLTSSATD